MKYCKVLLLICVGLVGCTSYYTKTIDYGQFYVEEDLHRSSSPLRVHSPTGLDERRVCSRTIDFCLKNTIIFERANSNIMTAGANGNTYFLDTSTGTQLKCQNCQNKLLKKEGLVLEMVRTSHPVSEYAMVWSEDGTKMFFSYIDKNDPVKDVKSEGYFHTAFIEYHSDGVIWTDVNTTNGEFKGIVARKKISADASQLGWFYCKPECELVQYDIKSKQYTHQLSPCTNIKNLEFIWKENQAIPLHKGRSTMPHAKKDGGVCLNEEGQPYFPISNLQFYN